jgi:hypothetical protein
MRTAFILCMVSGLLLGAARVAVAAEVLPARSGAASPAPGATPPPLADSRLIEALAPFAFLLGQWEGEGGGAPGTSNGRFSFEAAAGGHAIIRHNSTVTPGGPHEDVLVVYMEAGSPEAANCRALYVDNEGHTIHYEATATADPPRAEFVSDETPGMPRFRLTYRTRPDGLVGIVFEIAPPGSTKFKTYLEGAGRRVEPR